MVGVGDMAVSKTVGDLIVTHALGSCLGVSLHDNVAHVGGLLHAMLPSATLNPEKARVNPSMFVDTGFPAMLKKLFAAGASKERLIVKVAGGAITPADDAQRFSIGKRNYGMLRKTLWQFGLMVDSEDIGGDVPRTMSLEIGSGRVLLQSAGEQWEL